MVTIDWSPMIDGKLSLWMQEPSMWWSPLAMALVEKWTWIDFPLLMGTMYLVRWWVRFPRGALLGVVAPGFRKGWC